MPLSPREQRRLKRKRATARERAERAEDRQSEQELVLAELDKIPAGQRKEDWQTFRDAAVRDAAAHAAEADTMLAEATKITDTDVGAG